MLINGERVNEPFRRELRYPRLNGDIVLQATSISCSKDFEDLYPAPEPPSEKDVRGNVVKVLHDDPEYHKKINERTICKFDYQVIRSLENVKWETVDLQDPKTWKNWRMEAVESGLSDLEVLDIINKVIETLQPSTELVERMKKDFLATQGQKG